MEDADPAVFPAPGPEPQATARTDPAPVAPGGEVFGAELASPPPEAAPPEQPEVEPAAHAYPGTEPNRALDPPHEAGGAEVASAPAIGAFDDDVLVEGDDLGGDNSDEVSLVEGDDDLGGDNADEVPWSAAQSPVRADATHPAPALVHGRQHGETDEVSLGMAPAGDSVDLPNAPRRNLGVSEPEQIETRPDTGTPN